MAHGSPSRAARHTQPACSPRAHTACALPFRGGGAIFANVWYEAVYRKHGLAMTTSPDSDAAAQARLRQAGLRPTRQRIVLARRLFDGPHRHVTAAALHAEVLREEAGVSLATVYNTLHQFTKAGLLREMVVDAGRSFFDTNTDHHQHFFFEETGQLVDVPGDRISVSALPPTPPGTTVSRIDIVIRVTGKGAGQDGAATGRAPTLE